MGMKRWNVTRVLGKFTSCSEEQQYEQNLLGNPKLLQSGSHLEFANTSIWPWWTIVQKTLTCQSVPPALDRHWYGRFHYRSVHGWNLCISETQQQWPLRPLGYGTGQNGILCDVVALARTLYRAPLKWKEKWGNVRDKKKISKGQKEGAGIRRQYCGVSQASALTLFLKVGWHSAYLTEYDH